MNKNIIIHKLKVGKYRTNYYFTKSKTKCLVIEHDEQWDFGTKSTSGTSFRRIEIHYQNSWVKDELTEITINEVPQTVIDVLSYLK